MYLYRYWPIAIFRSDTRNTRTWQFNPDIIWAYLSLFCQKISSNLWDTPEMPWGQNAFFFSPEIVCSCLLHLIPTLFWPRFAFLPSRISRHPSLFSSCATWDWGNGQACSNWDPPAQMNMEDEHGRWTWMPWMPWMPWITSHSTGNSTHSTCRWCRFRQCSFCPAWRRGRDRNRCRNLYSQYIAVCLPMQNMFQVVLEFV